MTERTAPVQQLSPLVGSWTTESPQFPSMPGGTATFEWIEGGAYLLHRSFAPDPVPDGIMIVGADDDVDSANLTVLYHDSRGVSRVLVELGFFVGLTLGQQRWIKTLDIRHHEVLPGTGGGLAVEARREGAVLVDGGPDHGVSGPLVTGIGSPVTIDSSRDDWPLTTSPSIGIFSTDYHDVGRHDLLHRDVGLDAIVDDACSPRLEADQLPDR